LDVLCTYFVIGRLSSNMRAMALAVHMVFQARRRMSLLTMKGSQRYALTLSIGACEFVKLYFLKLPYIAPSFPPA